MRKFLAPINRIIVLIYMVVIGIISIIGLLLLIVTLPIISIIKFILVGRGMRVMGMLDNYWDWGNKKLTKTYNRIVDKKLPF